MEYHVTMKVRNGRMLRLMEETGFPTVPKLSDASGVNAARLYHMLNMTDSPYQANSDTEWKRTVIQIADFFGVPPTELFPTDMRVLPTNKIGKYVERAQLAGEAYASPQIAWEREAMTKEVITKALAADRFSDRERAVISMRFEKGMALEAIGKEIGIQRERVRQIEAKILRKLRNKANSSYKWLKALYEEDCDVVDGSPRDELYND